MQASEDMIWLATFDQTRQGIVNKFRFLVMCQLMIVWFLGKDAFTSDSIIEQYSEVPSSISVVVCRFLCVTFLHIKLASKLNQSLSMMKYAINHPWKFNNHWFNAFMVGFSQLIVLVGIELVNMTMMLADHTLIQVVMNFIYLFIVSEFGEFYFSIVSNEKLSKLVSVGQIMLDGRALTLKALLEIETTTSDEARVVNEANELGKVPESLLLQPILIENGSYISHQRY